VKKLEKTGNLIAPFIMFLVIFGTWELLIIALDIPRWILPGPIAIFQTMVKSFMEFLPHILVSMETIFVGFIIAVPIGIIFALLIVNFNLLAVTADPYIIFLVVTPLITLVPLLMYFFGFGIGVRILAVIIQSFAIVLMNSVTGFLNVESLKLELMQSLRANRVQTFLNVLFPAALPDVFTGMKLAGIFATMACISVEYIGGNEGLGSQIIRHTQFINTEKAFSCIFFVAIIGITLYMLITLLERLSIRWKI